MLTPEPLGLLNGHLDRQDAHLLLIDLRTDEGKEGMEQECLAICGKEEVKEQVLEAGRLYKKL